MLRSLHSSSSSDTDNNSGGGGCKNNGGGGEAAVAGGGGCGDQRAVAAAPSTRDLLLACADLLQRGDLPAARRAAEIVLSAAASPRGDAADRLAYHFARALALRADAKAGHVVVGGGGGVAARPASSVAYLAFNQIAPFLRFAHLTANQAILEAVDGARRVHILDLDAVHGVQWPPPLHAIAERADPELGPPEVRITGAGADRDTLLRTGNRLRAFARSIHLPFHFTPLLLSCATTTPHVAGTSTAATASTAAATTTGLELHPDETLAVNCVMFLHNLGGHDEIAAFLKWVKAMSPAVVTIAEREAGGGAGGGDHIDDLPRRVGVAMDHYSAVFEALEATVPPGSRERLAVEQEVLGWEIEAAVGPSGGRWWRGIERWGGAARGAGFVARPLSAFAVSQARLLLRLHYPSEGYLVQEARGACFLGWQTRPLLSVSAWQPSS
uniref:Monoculm1 n=1 Tax=Oryza minuta TaxID=63629 RepID=C0JA49_ORYMI|nr:Monoculm1 [Oryza minuta]